MNKVFATASILAFAALSACQNESSSPTDKAAASATESTQTEAAAPGKPSFDCALAESEAEKMVCADNGLAQLDTEVARLFALAEKDASLTTKAKAELIAMQRGWVKGRDDCWKAEDKKRCVLTSFGQRAQELRIGYPNARSAAPNALSTGPVVFKCDGIDAPLGITFFTIEPGYAFLQNGDTAVMFTAVPDVPEAKYTAKSFDGSDYTLIANGDDVSYTQPDEAEAKCKRDEIG